VDAVLHLKRRPGLDVTRGARDRPNLELPMVWRLGVKRITRRGPGLMLEFRNHDISNAGTRGENLGVNAAIVVAGVHWVLR
jgi:hypothetical protein